MRVLRNDELAKINGGTEATAACSYTVTVTVNADGSTTTVKVLECHAKVAV